MQRFLRVFHKKEHLLSAFRQQHAALQQPPAEPSDLDMELLKKHWPPQGKQNKERPPDWLKSVAVQRDYFKNTVFMQSTSTGPVAWLLLFVMRSPVQAVAMQVQIDVPQPCCCDTGTSSETGSDVFSQWSFIPKTPRKFQLVLDSMFEDAPIFFVEDVFWEHGVLHSLHTAQELSAWLARYSVRTSRESQEREAKAPGRLSHALQPAADEHPWIKEYLQQAASSKRVPVAGHGGCRPVMGSGRTSLLADRLGENQKGPCRIKALRDTDSRWPVDQGQSRHRC